MSLSSPGTIAMTFPGFSLLYCSVPGISMIARSIWVTVPLGSVMIALVPFTSYMERAKMMEPSFNLML
jgi:hypothetical protein